MAAIHLDGTMRPFKEERRAGVKYVDPDRLAYRVQIADAAVAGAEVAVVRVVDTVEFVDQTADQQVVRGRLGAQVADPQRGHRHGGRERPAPAACVASGPDRHVGVLTPLGPWSMAAAALTVHTWCCVSLPAQPELCRRGRSWV